MSTQILDGNNDTTQVIDDAGATATLTLENATPMFVNNITPEVSAASDILLKINSFSGEELDVGVIVNGWKIKNRMNVTSGEADLYRVEQKSVESVFKYYKGNHTPKLAILEKIKNLKNPHTMRLLEYGKYNGRFFEISEYEKGGSIDAVKKDGSYKYLPLEEEKVFGICRDIVEAYNEFHKAGIIHRDIKPSNIYLRDKNSLDVVIGDFGISSIMDEGEELHKTRTLSRTDGYAPRELFTADYNGIGVECDYYSLGIVLWEFATGGKPFVNLDGKKRNPQHILRDTFEGRIADDLLSRKPVLSPKMQKLIRGLLVVNYENRWGYNEVIRHLNDENVELLEEKKKFNYVLDDGKTYSREEDFAVALWNNKEHVTYRALQDLSRYLTTEHFYIAPKISEVMQDIVDKDDLDIPILKIVYYLNEKISLDGGHGYYFTCMDDVVECLKNAPEIVVPALEDKTSPLFTYMLLVAGEDLAEKLVKVIDEEMSRNDQYYNGSDNMLSIKLVSKARILFADEIITPFKSDSYENIQLIELDDLKQLNEELRITVLEYVRQNVYEGDIVPWLELKTGKRKEEFNTSDWDSFLMSLTTV